MAQKYLTPATLTNGTKKFKGLLEGPSFKVGDKITFKDDDTLWDVVEVFDTIDPAHIKRGWNNNI